MKALTTITDEKVISLIKDSFTPDGSPIKKGRFKRTKQALDILENGINYYQERVNGFDVHNCLLIIAYPEREI